MPCLSPNVWADADRSTPRVILDPLAGDMRGGTAHCDDHDLQNLPDGVARLSRTGGSQAGLAWAN